MSQKSKFWQWIDHRVRVTIGDRRMLVGTFIAFDKHLNVVLAETEEFRVIRAQKQGEPDREIKRPLGLIIIRGDNIISISAEKAPHMYAEKKPDLSTQGPGKATPIVRPGNVGVSNVINMHTEVPVPGNGSQPSNGHSGL